MKKQSAAIAAVLMAAVIGVFGFFAGKFLTEDLTDPNTQHIKLGLDLAGGVSITYKVAGDQTPTEEDFADTQQKLQMRAETYSTEAQVYREGTDRISIEIPGENDADKVLADLGSPGSLYFLSEKDSEGNDNYSYFMSQDGGVVMGITKTIEELEKDGCVLLSGSDVLDAKGGYQQDSLGNNQPVVRLDFTPEGTKKFADATTKAFQNGEIDILDCDSIDSAVAETFKINPMYSDNIVYANRLATTYLALNENVQPLDDVNVRKAIQMAIDRQSILDAIYAGEGVTVDGIYPAGSIGFTEENQGWLTYDPDGAKALLEEAGYGDGFDMELSADASASASVANVLQIIAENLQAVGINATIENYDEAAWLTLRKSGEMPSFTDTWTLDYNDPSNIIDTFFSSPDTGTLRSLNYADEEVMARVRAASAIVDEGERLAEYAALEKKIVEEDAAWVPLYTRQHLFEIIDLLSYRVHPARPAAVPGGPYVPVQGRSSL